MKGETALVHSSTTVLTIVENAEPLVLAPAFAVSSPEREKPPRLVQQHSSSSDSDEKLSELERKGGVAQVAESLRWVQKHPVLAAVIWVFGKVVPHDLGAAAAARSESEPCISSGSAAADDAQAGSGEKKTSSRRLSWNDERGGTLAEYFEDPRPRFDVVESSEGELLLRMGNDDSARASAVHEPEGVHLHNCSALYDDLAGPLDGGGCKGFLPNGALPSAGTWSPQWGWYVNMTPPQEMYPCPNPTVGHPPGESQHSRNAGGAAAIVPKYPRR